MTTQRPRWSQPATTPEKRPAETLGDDVTDASVRPRMLPHETGRDPAWAWPQTLRFAILVSGAFWLIVGLCVWAYLSAG